MSAGGEWPRGVITRLAAYRSSKHKHFQPLQLAILTRSVENLGIACGARGIDRLDRGHELHK